MRHGTVVAYQSEVCRDIYLGSSSAGMRYVRPLCVLNPLKVSPSHAYPRLGPEISLVHPCKAYQTALPFTMDAQGPPLHYPNSHESTDEIYRTRQSSRRSSPPVSPRHQPPAYEEGAPPQYQEEEAGEIKDEANRKRTVCVRLLTSLFIVVIVALIVAAVFGRINEVKVDEKAKLEDGKFVIPLFFPW